MCRWRKNPTERIALETVCGCVRAGAARFLRQGVVPRYRGIASVHYYMLANCGPAKCCVRPVAAPAGVFVRAGAGLRGGAALSRRFAFGSCLPCGSLTAFCVRVTPFCLPHSAKQNGLRNAPFLFRRGSGSPFARSRIVDTVIRISWFTSRLRVFWRRSRRGTKRCGGRGRRRGMSALLRDRIGFAMLSAGSPLGRNVEAALRPRPQTCAKETRLHGLSSFDS